MVSSNSVKLYPVAMTPWATDNFPPFVEAEDEIILDTRTLEYVKKIN